MDPKRILIIALFLAVGMGLFFLYPQVKRMFFTSGESPTPSDTNTPNITVLPSSESTFTPQPGVLKIYGLILEDNTQTHSFLLRVGSPKAWKGTDKWVKLNCPISDSWVITTTIDQNNPQNTPVVSARTKAQSSLDVLANPQAGDNFSGVCSDSSCATVIRDCELNRITLK